ncbi:MAG TPA: hypothetical protein VFX98_10205 [Longimicrobiaceae bacterium]|nr:hypothetical protein [Longimicrobiaceae bacterium]
MTPRPRLPRQFNWENYEEFPDDTFAGLEPLEEGKVDKGGINPGPTTPRPPLRRQYNWKDDPADDGPAPGKKEK